MTAKSPARATQTLEYRISAPELMRWLDDQPAGSKLGYLKSRNAELTSAEIRQEDSIGILVLEFKAGLRLGEP